MNFHFQTVTRYDVIRENINVTYVNSSTLENVTILEGNGFPFSHLICLHTLIICLITIPQSCIGKVINEPYQSYGLEFLRV